MTNIMPLTEAKRKKKRLIRLLADSHRSKSALTKALKGLDRQYYSEIISNDAYIIRKDALLGTRSLDEWKEIYDNYSRDCLESIDHLDSHIQYRMEKQESMPISPSVPYLMLAAFVIIIGFFMIKPALTGFVIHEEGVNVSQTIDITFKQSMNFTWTPTSNGDIHSIRLSGITSLEGTAIVSIINDNKSYVIFNSSEIDFSSLDPAEFKETNNNSISGPIIIASGTPPLDEVLNIAMEYKQGTPSDIEDDGYESTGGTIDLTVENTLTGLDESNLCTVWKVNNAYEECYGSGVCCDFVETSRYENDWNNPFIIYYGLDGTNLDNNVTAQVWYVDYNLSIENPYSYIYSSDMMQMPARFYYRGYEFKDECKETCMVSGLGFNKSNYTIQVEISDSQLEISSVDYTAMLEEPGMNETLVQYEAVINKDTKWVHSKKFADMQKNVSVNISEFAENISISSLKEEKGMRFTILKKDKNMKKVDDSLIRIRINGSEMGIKVYNLKKEIEKLQKKINKEKDAGNKNDMIDEIDELVDELEEIDDSVVIGDNTSKITEIIVLEETDEIQIEYYTEGPESIEKEMDANSKQITVSSDINYTNILTYTTLPDEADAGDVHLYWIVNDTRQEVLDFTRNDTDSNGLIDWIEWITPHLSNQTYIVEIDAVGEYNLSQGTFVNTTFDSENVTLNKTGGDYYASGYYESQVIDAGSPARWKNLTWEEAIPYGENLPDNSAAESAMGGANMSKNLLLLHMDEESGIIQDTSGNSNDATGYGITYNITGKLGKGIGFDGTDDNVNVTGSLGLETDDLAVEFWFSPDEDYNSSTDYVSLIFKYNYALYIANGTMAFKHDSIIVNSTTNEWNKDSWYHIAGTYNSTVQKIYVNGIEQGSVNT